MNSMKESRCRRVNNRRLRALLVRLQDRLSEDDRRRFNFFLGDDVPRRFRDDPSLGGTLCIMESLFDQDKINEEDFSFLINAFDEIQCLDAVKLLREHMRQIQSNGFNESVQSLSVLMPPVIDQLLADEDEDKFDTRMSLLNQENFTNNNNIIINSNNNNINSEIIENDNSKRRLSLSTQKQFLNISRRTYLILFILSLIIQVGVIIGGCIWIFQLKIPNKVIPNEEIKNNNITYLQIKDFLLKDKDIFNQFKSFLSIDNEKLTKLNKQVMDNEESIKNLVETVNYLDDEIRFTEGKTCGCHQWCRENGGRPYGVCGNGHTCICRSEPITRTSVGDQCRCGEWCERRNYTKGGICGDGYTCICTP